jgi:hypothetical protein
MQGRLDIPLHRDHCPDLGILPEMCDGSGNGSGGTFEWVDSGKGVLPKMEAWMGARNGTIHSLTSNWIELQ